MSLGGPLFSSLCTGIYVHLNIKNFFQIGNIWVSLLTSPFINPHSHFVLEYFLLFTYFWYSTNLVFLDLWEISALEGKVNDENKTIIVTDVVLWSPLSHVLYWATQRSNLFMRFDFLDYLSIAPALTFSLYYLLNVFCFHVPHTFKLNMLKKHLKHVFVPRSVLPQISIFLSEKLMSHQNNLALTWEGNSRLTFTSVYKGNLFIHSFIHLCVYLFVCLFNSCPLSFLNFTTWQKGANTANLWSIYNFFLGDMTQVVGMEEVRVSCLILLANGPLAKRTDDIF